MVTKKETKKKPKKEVAKPHQPATIKSEALEEVKKEKPKEALPGPKPKKKHAAKSAANVAIARGKRKESIARAVVCAGSGRVSINNVSVNAFSNQFIKDMIMEPVAMLGDEGTKINISVRALGGGMMGQAQAARNAIAKALLIYLKDDGKLKEEYLKRDRNMLIEDSRRVEPKKYKGPKARARFQKSYR